MYVPEAFREEGAEVPDAFIAEDPLAIVSTNGPDGPETSLVPMILAAGSNGRRVLRGHLARANPHWRAIGAGLPAVALFCGARQHVTPSWYPSKRETGKVVPTFDYEVVEVRGPLTAREDARWLADQIRALTDHQEADRPAPWSGDDMPGAFASAMVRGIVGIELAATTVVGKMKAGRNRPEKDRRGLLDGLAAVGTPDALALASHIARALDGPAEGEGADGRGRAG